MTRTDPIRILLADNDKDYRKSVRRLLEQAGYEVVEAGTVAQALEMLLNFLYNLAIVEPRLADSNDSNDTSGLEAAERASKFHIPVIVNTAYPSLKLTRLAFFKTSAAPASDMVAKSDGPQVLLEAVERMIRKTMTNTEVTSEPPINESSGKHEAVPDDDTRGIPKMGATTDQDEEVHFTALHSKEGQVDVWQTLLVYVHIGSALDQVRADAKRFLDEIKTQKEVSAPAQSKLKRGTEITIIPSCEGVTFNPGRTSLKWLEDVQRADFRFRADPSLQGDAAKGLITFYVGPLIVGTLKFAMLFDQQSAVVDHEEHGQMYRHDRIFISYSHKDTDIALSFKKVHEATGHDVLIDIDDLRSGEEWNPALMRMIDNADIFQLFWSENSKASKYCRQEWDHALKRGVEGFIRPVFWSQPMPDPPDELGRYHFEYVEL